MQKLIVDKRRGASSVIIVLVARNGTEQRASEAFKGRDVLAPSTRLTVD